MYIADLKEQIGAPIVISMSLGGPEPSGIEEAAIDYAIGKGVPVVAAAGNKGTSGMDWPGAYEQVISVGACGWTLEWIGGGPPAGWWMDDVPENLNTPDTLGNTFQGYITDFSGREMTGQDLDIVAPGSWVVGPYFPNGVSQPQGGYYYLGGTSMATPHVSGIVALMLQKNPTMAALAIEPILETSCVSIPTTSAWVINPFTGNPEEMTWGSDATGAGIIQADLAISNTPP